MPGASRGWEAIARPVWLLALISGLLVVGFQSRLSPRPPHPGPAKLRYSSIAPVKFPMPERQEQGQEQACELHTFALVPPAPLRVLEAPPRAVFIADAGGRSAVTVRAPPPNSGLL